MWIKVKVSIHQRFKYKYISRFKVDGKVYFWSLWQAREGDPGSYQDDSEVPDRMYKRIFYTHGLVYNQSPENQRSESKPMDEKKPLPARFREFQASDAEQKLKTLIALRDRAKSIHEDLAHSVLKQEALMENRREQQRKAPEWDKILEGW